jgi:hypothetical protein
MPKGQPFDFILMDVILIVYPQESKPALYGNNCFLSFSMADDSNTGNAPASC